MYVCVKITQMILHLDNGFKLYNDEPEINFETFTFSGGEPHIKIKPNFDMNQQVLITHRIKSFNDVGLLLLAVNALRNMEVKVINLWIPYFPAARQDRIMVRGEALSVKVYADIINSQHFNSVSLFDPHSEVTPALVNNCKAINNHTFINEVTKELSDNLLLISPDAGAQKKVYHLATYLNTYDVVECSKSRDLKTGQLSDFKVFANDLRGKDCLIVDDICDGGGTFLGLAKELKAKNAGKLYLAVSHGVFSKGFENLNQQFEKIFTTDSFQTITKQTKLKQINLSKLIN